MTKHRAGSLYARPGQPCGRSALLLPKQLTRVLQNANVQRCTEMYSPPTDTGSVM